MASKDAQRKLIRFPNIAGMTVDRAPDETGPFVKSDVDAHKAHKAMASMHPFSRRSHEDIMEFVCYMFEVQGVPGDNICSMGERNHNFYFVAGGELLHRRSSGPTRRGIEQKLFESDSWGAECLFTGRDDRISVTVTMPCRLLVLTARRFLWLCTANAQRTLRLQRLVIERLTVLRSVRQFLGITTEGRSSLSKANFKLLDLMLHSIRQVEVPAQKDSKTAVQISCLSGQHYIVYVLIGCAKLMLDHCTNFTDFEVESAVVLEAGEFKQIKPNQLWVIRQGGRDTPGQCEHTIIYLIKLTSLDGSSSENSTVE